MHRTHPPTCSNTAANTRCFSSNLDVAHALLQFLQFLLEVGVLLGHFLVLVLPFIAGLLQGLDFALEVTGLDVGLSEPAMKISTIMLAYDMGYLTSRWFLAMSCQLARLPPRGLEVFAEGLRSECCDRQTHRLEPLPL